MTRDRSFLLSRRKLLAGAGALAALPMMAPISVAAASGDSRFVTIILRGAMDGLDLVQPYGDAAFATLRPTLALKPETGLIDLDGFFGLHPAAADLMPLWQARELAFVHAVATPYRGGRNHFEGQDILENGGREVGEKSGWLNRALAVLPRSGLRQAVNVSGASELILNGPNDAQRRGAHYGLALAGDEERFFEELFSGDEEFAKVWSAAATTDGGGPPSQPAGAARTTQISEIGRIAGSLLRENYRIANFSIAGWDTHVDQKTQFPKAVGDLTTAIMSLKEALGTEAWNKTVVLAVTEFGRAARENDKGGTEHGTASVALLAGGAVAGGQVHGQWPGLTPDQLLDGQDLSPTGDLRAVAASLLQQQFEVSPGNLTTKVFPGLTLDGASNYLKG